MKNYKKLKGSLATFGMFSIACVLSQSASAGSYNSSVDLPTIYSKNYVYTAHVSVPAGPQNGLMIKNVSWNWNVHGWPLGLQVYLCQTAARCIDVSRQRTGSTNSFNRFHSTQPFYYEMKMSAPGNVPVAGQRGLLTVTW